MSLARDGACTGAHDDRRLLVKAVLDRVVAAVLLLLTAVWLLLVCTAIWLDRSGPVFSRELRLGRHGIPFWLLRFRSTVLALAAEGVTTPGLAGDAVARVRQTTGLGRRLQRYHLDELPQLINVLRGEMSIVGPRPQDPRAVPVGAAAPAPLPVKPGLTGLYRAGSGYGHHRTEQMDVAEYVRDYSLSLDLTILRCALQSERSGGDVG